MAYMCRSRKKRLCRIWKKSHCLTSNFSLEDFIVCATDRDMYCMLPVADACTFAFLYKYRFVSTVSAVEISE